jgi:hypothetical protein
MEVNTPGGRKKRKRRQGPKPNTCFTERSTIKVSLSHILKLKALGPKLTELVHVVNQLRVLMSYVWKTHMILLHEQGLPPPRIDDSYLCVIGTQLKGGTSKKALPPLLSEVLQRSFLKKRWTKEQQRQRFMDRVVDEVAGTTDTPLAERPILLFGRGGEKGWFCESSWWGSVWSSRGAA